MCLAPRPQKLTQLQMLGRQEERLAEQQRAREAAMETDESIDPDKLPATRSAITMREEMMAKFKKEATAQALLQAEVLEKEIVAIRQKMVTSKPIHEQLEFLEGKLAQQEQALADLDKLMVLHQERRDRMAREIEAKKDKIAELKLLRDKQGPGQEAAPQQGTVAGSQLKQLEQQLAAKDQQMQQVMQQHEHQMNNLHQQMQLMQKQFTEQLTLQKHQAYNDLQQQMGLQAWLHQQQAPATPTAATHAAEIEHVEVPNSATKRTSSPSTPQSPSARKQRPAHCVTICSDDEDTEAADIRQALHAAQESERRLQASQGQKAEEQAPPFVEEPSCTPEQ